jgi:SprT protein
MALKAQSLDILIDYLPEHSFEEVLYFMHTYSIHLILRKDRKSVLGDYRPPYKGKPHTISLNISLNKYHLLVTFIHEVAHLITYLNHRQRVSPHGPEWKATFAMLLQRFTKRDIFPDDIKQALQASMQQLSASTCSDPLLYKTLQRYNQVQSGAVFVDELPEGAIFRTPQNRVYRLLHKRRTRYECEEIATGLRYLFPGIYEVQPE